MSTIASMTDDGPSPGASSRTGEAAPDDPSAAGPGQRPAHTTAAAAAAAQRRSVLVPVLVAVVVTLIGGVFGLAVAGFNTLRDDIGALQDNTNNQIDTLRDELGSVRDELRGDIGMLRADMDSQIGELRADMDSQIGGLRADMVEGFSEINTVLLDHTDRLARIETIHDIHPDHAPQP